MDGSISVRPSRSARLRLTSGFAAEIAAANPHMRDREVEIVAPTIFDEIASALARGDRWNCAALGLSPSDAREAHAGRNPRNGADGHQHVGRAIIAC
jgi:nucleoid DNA-binding protein